MKLLRPVSAILALSILLLPGCGKKILTSSASPTSPEAEGTVSETPSDTVVSAPVHRPVPETDAAPPPVPAELETILPEEFRAAWLTTVKGLDWPDASEGPVLQRIHLSEMIRNIKAAGCNVVFFQVVSNSDALYPSALYPWSRVLSGKEGIDPGYDPLAEAVRLCKAAGMEIHAWLNPLRIGPVSDERTPSHPAFRHKGWTFEYQGSLFWDPGVPQVRDMVASVAREIVDNYDVDGIHIDDYFYPYGFREDPSNKKYDALSYSKYSAAGESLDSWRTRNVDCLVKAMSDAVHKARPSAVFGVSPGGRLVNTRRLYADPERWAAQGTVDYLAPQIYWDNNRTDDAAFPVALKDFSAATAPVPLVPGLAAYKIYSEAEQKAGFFLSMDVFSEQVRLTRENPRCIGNAWFRVEHFTAPAFSDYMRSGFYYETALTPRLGASPEVLDPVHLEVLPGRVLAWSACSEASDYVLLSFRREGDRWRGTIVYEGPERRFKPGPGPVRYAVIARRGAARSGLSEMVKLPPSAAWSAAPGSGPSSGVVAQ